MTEEQNTKKKRQKEIPSPAIIERRGTKTAEGNCQ
jgi:hypothetical protein